MVATPDSPNVRLFDLPISHYCVKVRAILGYKGIAYERVHAPYHDRQELLQVSGQDYVPYLEWEGRGVTWPHIADFLEEKVPEPSLYPSGERHVPQMLENWAHAVLEEQAWRYVCSDAPNVFADPRERWVFEEMQTRSRGPLEAMAARKPEFLASLDQHLGILEGAFGERDWLCTVDAPSLADFAVYGALSPIWNTGNAIPEHRVGLREWKARVEKVANLG